MPDLTATLPVDIPGDVAALAMPPLRREELEPLRTPAYVYDGAVAVARYEALRAALGTRLVVSFKANNLVDLLVRCGHRFTDGIELASIGELGVVTGRLAQRRFVNNPAMDDDFMRAAIVSGCDFIVDGVEQARRLAAAASTQRRTRALLRLNAAAIGTASRSPDHFGMDLDDAREATRRLADSPVQVTGVHCFAGSQTFARHGVVHAGNVARAVETLESGAGPALAEINLGGGFEADWEQRPELLDAYRARLDELFGGERDLAHESGRGIFAGAGAFVTRVVAVKQLGDTCVAACDGGMAQNFLLAATEGALRRRPCPRVVRHASDATLPARPGHPVKYVGSSCSRMDVIGLDPHGGMPEAGDFCVFDQCGAYNAAYTVSRFLMLPAATLYLRGAG